MNEFKFGSGLIAAMPLLIGVLLASGPVVKRRGLMFSVRVKPEWSGSAEAGAILHAYRLQVAGLTICAIFLSIFGLLTANGWAVAGWPLILLGGWFGAFAGARRQTLPHADPRPPVRTATLGVPDSPEFNAIQTLVPFAILAGAAYWLNLHWDAIPARFPIHWDLAGKANGWSSRTTSGVYGPLAIGALICLTMVLSELGIVYGSPRAMGGTRTVRWQTVKMMRRMAHLMGLMFAVIAVAPLYPQKLRPGLLAPAIVLATILMVVPVIRASNAAEGSAEQTPDRAWKLGLFYYNPADPALMVEKRIGIGYTFNFANPVALILTAAVLALPIVVVIWKRFS